MCCDYEVMDFDGEDMSFMMGPSNVDVYEHRFINTSTIDTTKRGPVRDTIDNNWKWKDPVVIY